MTYFFDKLYRLGAWGAAACMLLICAVVSLQVFLRLIDAILVTFGAERLGFEISGVSEMAAFLLVGATFLSLAYTFTHHAHIRVTLVINRLPAAGRVWIESLALLIALALSVLITRELVLLVGESLNITIFLPDCWHCRCGFRRACWWPVPACCAWRFSRH
ncbi:TRAP transporter small permease [Cobetia crustatorum]|uniref:TRAP transporter small permease n=1 Tax=Cobetia crustatorum TaxID=553385 RepID=UPI0004BB4F0E